MSYSDICNAPWMYIWVGVLLIAVIVQCLIFMKKAWTRARGLGLSNQQIRKGLTTGVTLSIVPTLPVLVVFLSLMPLLGAPLPWLRLSVIGSAYYETYAATTALECVGESLTVNGYSAVGWIAAAWVMTVGGSACILWSTIMIKPISSLYNKAEKIDMGLVLAIGQGDPITRVSESTFRKSFRFLLAVVAIGIALAATSPNQEFVQKLEAQAFPNHQASEIRP